MEPDEDLGLTLTKSQLRLRVLLQAILIFHETDLISDIVLFSGVLGAGICMFFMIINIYFLS